MISRTRFLITAACLCHLLLTPHLVTSQLLAAQNRPAESQSATPVPSPLPREENVTISATDSQEKDGPVYKLRGHVEIHYRTYTLYADEVTFNSDTGEAVGEGHMVLDGGPNDEHIEASHGTYNLRSQSGKFYDVLGTIGVRVKGTATVLTSSSPFAFAGKVVEKTGPDHFIVNDGSVTTCEMPHPNWTFNARKVVVDVGANATVYRSSFRIRGVPVFYFPYAAFPAHPLAKEIGILDPKHWSLFHKGNDRRRVGLLGDQSQHGCNCRDRVLLPARLVRARRISRASQRHLVYRSHLLRSGRSQEPGRPGCNLQRRGPFPANFRSVANIDYLSSFVFRLAFGETFTQAVNSEVKSQAFLSNTTRGFSFNALVQRYQNFQGVCTTQGTQPVESDPGSQACTQTTSSGNGDVITILHAPSFQFSSVDQRITHTPFFWSLDAAAEGLSRSEKEFRTANLVGRFDLAPSISLPLLFRGWSLRPELTLRKTAYTQRLEPGNNVGTAVSDVVNRKALEGSVELRPPALTPHL